MTTRVRFAPSPTGDPHLGNIRTAVFDYLFAKATGGAFLLRVEDTDRERLNDGSVERMYEALKWLGIEPDEGVYVDGQGNICQRGDVGPYIQSERKNIYAEYAKELLEAGKAYRCFATSEELEEMRKAQQAAGLPPRYDRRFRDLPCEESDRRATAGEAFVIRQAMPLEGEVLVKDLIRGDVTFKCQDLDDHVLLKKDGYPTYQFANVVDDHLMGITHVLRGEEYVSSAPKNVLLYQAFGWEPPIWAHLPLILGSDKAKLSKRHGAETVLIYRDRGYLPEAMLNALAFLGWNPGTEEEFFNKEELAKRFTLERIQKAPAVFGPERLDYVNGWYIRQLSNAEVAHYMKPWLEKEGVELNDEAYLERVASLLKDRFKHFDETYAFSWFFFKRPEVTEELKSLIVPKKLELETVRENLAFAIEILEKLADWSHHSLHTTLMEAITSAGKKNGEVLWPIRAALTGEVASPGAFEMLEVLGKEESLVRLRNLL
jgi:glutamyl-tRNA synthetase